MPLDACEHKEKTASSTRRLTRDSIRKTGSDARARAPARGEAYLGEAYLIDLDPTRGSKIRKPKSCLAVSPDELNQYLQTVIVAPMTTGGQAHPWRVRCRFRDRSGFVAIDQLRTRYILSEPGRVLNPLVQPDRRCHVRVVQSGDLRGQPSAIEPISQQIDAGCRHDEPKTVHLFFRTDKPCDLSQSKGPEYRQDDPQHGGDLHGRHSTTITRLCCHSAHEGCQERHHWVW
jgi:hypothetical protein